jgi:hypothetical protein
MYRKYRFSIHNSHFMYRKYRFSIHDSHLMYRKCGFFILDSIRLKNLFDTRSKTLRLNLLEKRDLLNLNLFEPKNPAVVVNVPKSL